MTIREGYWREVTKSSEYIEAGKRFRIEQTAAGGSYPRDLIGDGITSDRLWVYEEPPKVGDVVETVEGLESLPDWSVVLDEDGDAWQRFESRWQMASSGIPEIWRYAPYTVLHIGVDRK